MDTGNRKHTMIGTAAAARARSGLIAAIALLLFSGCYTYAPLEPGPIPAGTQVRLELADRNAEPRAAGSIFARESLEGELVHADEREIVLRIRRDLGGSSAWSAAWEDSLRFGWDQLRRVEEKRLDVTRTSLVAAGSAAVGLVVLRVLFRQWAGGWTGRNGEPGLPEIGPGW
jgi:hypothetical protein